MMAIFAKMESDSNSRRLGSMYDQVFANGRPTPGRSGFGYRVLTEDPRYEEVEHEANIVRKMASQLLAGVKLGEIAKWVNEDQGRWREFTRYNDDGTTEKGVSEPWTISKIEHKLLSPMMAGYVHRNGHIKRGCWDKPILPFEDWKRIRKKLGRKVTSDNAGGFKLDNPKEARRRSSGHVGLLTGMLFTADGQRMASDTPTAKELKDGTPCKRQHNYTSPDGKYSIQREHLDAYVLHVFKTMEGNAPVEHQLLAADQARLAEIATAFDELDETRFISKTLSEERWAKQTGKLRDEEDKLNDRIAIAGDSLCTPTGSLVNLASDGDEVDWFNGMTYQERTLDGWWDAADLEQRKTLLRTKINRVVIHSTNKEALTVVRGEMSDSNWR